MHTLLYTFTSAQGGRILTPYVDVHSPVFSWNVQESGTVFGENNGKVRDGDTCGNKNPFLVFGLSPGSKVPTFVHPAEALAQPETFEDDENQQAPAGRLPTLDRAFRKTPPFKAPPGVISPARSRLRNLKEFPYRSHGTSAPTTR